MKMEADIKDLQLQAQEPECCRTPHICNQLRNVACGPLLHLKEGQSC